MADVSLFLQQGWKHIWKQNSIFLFSSLIVFTNFMYFFTEGSQASPFLLIFVPVIAFVFPFINIIGVSYLAYRSLTGNPAGVREGLDATRKFWPRVIGCSALVVLIISPILLIAFFIVRIYSPATQGMHFLDHPLAGILLMPFGCLLDFCLFGFFAHNEDIGPGLKKAWSLFTHHFWTLAILSVILSVLVRGSLLLSAVLTLLFENGFEVASLAKINMFNPGFLLRDDLLYMLISGVGQIILGPFSSLVYGSAYLKYAEPKDPS